MTGVGVASYGAAALVYGLTTIVLLVSHPGGRRPTWILVATAASVLWGGGMAALLVKGGAPVAYVTLEIVHSLAWMACVLSWLASSNPSHRAAKLALLGISLAFAALAALGSLGADPVRAAANGLPFARQPLVFLPLLGMELVGLLTVEQVYRNADDGQRRALGLLCLGAGAIFIINIFAYSQAILLNGLVPHFWQWRGLTSAALVPLIVIAIKGTSEWERELFISRQVAFYTASLVVIGGYLLVMGLTGYLIRAMGGRWGLLLESVFLLIALATMVGVMCSSRISGRAKVFLVKHFYRNKYDYRYEWLRLTSALGRKENIVDLSASALDAIARIVGSREGGLWLARDARQYHRIAALTDREIGENVYYESHRIVGFLRSSGWVIDSDEYARRPKIYGLAFGDPAEGVLPADSIIVPLDCQGHLQGFVILTRPPELSALNFEDHDILKTAGRQVAVVLAQMLAQEELAATRQFEAMNKLATFLMHDLKNVVAQQELIVQNARKFKHRPEFIDDAIRAMEAGAQRLRNILRRLENAGRGEQSARVDLVKLLEKVCADCADRKPAPMFVSRVDACFAQIDRDRIAMAVTHALRNAQDATPVEGRIGVELDMKGSMATIDVADTGAGMSSEFIRDRLFKPFDSTKGVKGMGIGAYQIRETFRSAGGDVYVDSKPQQGTTVRMVLPVLATEGDARVRAQSVA